MSTGPDGDQAAQCRTHQRVPDLELHVGRSILNLFEDDRLRPLPGTVDGEKAADDAGGKRRRVELADAGRQHRPSDAAEEAGDVRVDGPAFGPELDRPKRVPEDVDVWHKVQDQVGDAGACERGKRKESAFRV